MLKLRLIFPSLVILLFCASVGRAQPRSIERSRSIKYELPSFYSVVTPMKHPLGDRMPLLVWNLPLPPDQQLIWSRQSGALRRAIDQLAQHGVVPTVMLPGGTGAVALAQTLQDAGQPVYLLIPKVDLIETTAWRDSRVWAEGPNANQPGRSRKWPCLPLADPQPGARYISELLAPFHQAGIPIHGVFYDDEGEPTPWNGIYEATRDSADCRGHYPPGVLDSFDAFSRYTLKLRVKLTREILADPVHKLYPQALVGNFGDSLSTEQTPSIDSNGFVSPPMGCGGDVAMPVLYANNILLPRLIQQNEVLTQQRADEGYLFTLLRTLSTCAPNARAAGKKLMPYLGQAVFDSRDPHLRITMSDAMWRELLHHVWLRGADGMYLFNLGYPGSMISPEYSFKSVEAAREVYDELLAYREFLDKGEPMNYAYPKLFSGKAIWSGLRLPDRCLIRAFTPGSTTQSVQVTAYPGVTVTLDAPPQGAMYLVGKDGKVEKKR